MLLFNPLFVTETLLLKVQNFVSPVTAQADEEEEEEEENLKKLGYIN